MTVNVVDWRLASGKLVTLDLNGLTPDQLQSMSRCGAGLGSGAPSAAFGVSVDKRQAGAPNHKGSKANAPHAGAEAVSE